MAEKPLSVEEREALKDFIRRHVKPGFMSFEDLLCTEAGFGLQLVTGAFARALSS